MSSVALIRDRYELLDVLGRGGQGEVWKALDQQHRRVVALKLRSAPDDNRRHELLDEARILLSLRPHPGLPLVREDFFWGDRYVLVMDWVEGADLGAILLDTGDPGLPVSSVLGWLREAADAIDHLHAQGIVHGDVKPANLVLTREGHVVLVDFGISREPHDRNVSRSGSPGYEAPEAGTGGLTAAADVYALAATAVALLTGTPPLGRPATWEGVPNATTIQRAVRRALDPDPSRRPRSASELVERLQAHLALDLPTGIITFLLTDIAGSTVRWESEPAVMSDLIARHDTMMAEAVEAAGGRLLKTRGEGDSTFSVFTKASGAVLAALEAQRALRRTTDLSVRMSIHTGEAETRDGDYYGRTVNRAARLRGTASGGQVLLSSAAADLVVDALPDGAALVDLGYRELRDLSRGEQVFELTHRDLDTPARSTAPARSAPSETEPAPDPESEPEFESRGPGEESGLVTTASASRIPFPGALSTARAANSITERDRDQSGAILRAFSRALEGERVVTVVHGDAGSGKTAVVAEAAARAYEQDAVVLYGSCNTDSTPLEPFVGALAGQLTDARVGGATVPALGPLAGELGRLVPEVGALPGVSTPLQADPEAEQYRLFDAVSSWLHAQATEAPLVVVLEDLQWATRDTVLLLRHVVRSTALLPVLFVITFRDAELSDDHPLAALLAELRNATDVEWVPRPATT